MINTPNRGLLTHAHLRRPCNPVALAALSRQLILISKELSTIAARAEDEVSEAAQTPDEAWDGAV
jgi:hypothetical protein